MPESSTTTVAYDDIAVVGGGAWGTALALVAAQAGRKTLLWARESAVVDSINRERRNAQFLPGIALPPALQATGDLAQAARAQALLIVVPAQHLRATLALLAPHLAPATPLLLCAKGIERGSGLLLTEVLHDAAPDAEPAILSGPSFAHDVAVGLPTAVTIAARLDIAQRLQASLAQAQFRPYASDDLAGVALGGAAKNVYAIGCGIADGLGLGDSARAALLARSFAELARLGEALGARAETLMGLSGLGDLVLTATSPASRNFAFGRKLGGGTPLAALRAPGTPLAEGVETAPALIARARRHGIELPIAETISAVLDGALAPAAALLRLMSRPLRPE
ncbi:MAG TPA: NAD(P)H-dependent glycerol-3-phosphate dehydrogenase [Rhizomicrobium sp.]|jgi:glycerol-3-phosphate dehydrogenase (NAD(P)+)|nr:NAD(P)H-dependent glycerol-3-phosphate dehydrogenase [Rhizomicrobium sp.]